MGLYVIDALAALFALIGFHLAFRQTHVRALAARLGWRRDAAGAAAEDPEGVASVLRIVGVMILAFSVTGAAFANLIAYYSASPPAG